MRLMSTMAALVLSAAALNVPAYAAVTAAVTTPAAVQATSAAKAAGPNAAAGKAQQPVSVPEPVHYKLILLGIAVLLLFARRGKVREQPFTK